MPYLLVMDLMPNYPEHFLYHQHSKRQYAKIINNLHFSNYFCTATQKFNKDIKVIRKSAFKAQSTPPGKAREVPQFTF